MINKPLTEQEFKIVYDIIRDVRKYTPWESQQYRISLQKAKEKGVVEINDLEIAIGMHKELNLMCDDVHKWIHEDGKMETTGLNVIKSTISNMVSHYEKHIKEISDECDECHKIKGDIKW